MASQGESERPSRLIDQVEVEVIREPRSPSDHNPEPVTHEANPLRALEELVERLEHLERAVSPEPGADDSSREPSCEAMLDMQRHLEQFQRQSAVLKRLLVKLH